MYRNGVLHVVENKQLMIGNSSQRSDGAAAVILAKRSTAERLGLPILGKFVAYAVDKDNGFRILILIIDISGKSLF